jgi:uncharacterized protein YqjF (DUF2071 family)
MANYIIDPAVLKDLTPRGTGLDLFEGKCFVSLVAFVFCDTRVLGVPVPFHVNFEEVNLRFYVRREAGGEVRRGVVFIKEIVPRFAIAFVARTLYGEPYESWRMTHRKDDTKIGYTWSKTGIEDGVSVTVGESLGVPGEDSEGSFIIEHYWGFTKRGGRTDEYRVEHPKWELFSVDSCEVTVDFGATYGEKFSFLNEQQPDSVLLAKGSEVAVYKGAALTD